MKKRLVILSDLWGIDGNKWINLYLKFLKTEFDIKYYDCCDLGRIDTSVYLENNLHQQFVNGGIDIAVEQLLKNERQNLDVLAFSIGGAIAWKAGVNGLRLNNLFAISSTRLRYESEKPNCKINLYFAQGDNYKPDKIWFESLNLKNNYLGIGGHDMYKEESIAKILSKDIIKTLNA